MNGKRSRYRKKRDMQNVLLSVGRRCLRQHFTLTFFKVFYTEFRNPMQEEFILQESFVADMRKPVDFTSFHCLI